MKNKKTILIIGGVVILGLMTLIIFFIFNNKEEEQQEETKVPDFLLSTSLDSNGDLSISGSIEIDDVLESVPLYYVEYESNIYKAEDVISNLGYDYEKNKTETDLLISWGGLDYDATFNYFTKTNILSFNIINSGSNYLSINKNNAEEKINQFFEQIGLEYEYQVTKFVSSDKHDILYLNRLVEGYPVEIQNNKYGFTDYLVFSPKGELLYGNILFAEFTNDFNYVIPLVDTKNLTNFINQEEYPKDIRIDSLEFLDYYKDKMLDYEEGPLSKDVEEVSSTVKDCSVNDASLVYLYSGTVDSYLVPTYKLSCISTAMYEDTEYSVSSIVYINAVSPDYVSVEE